MTTVAESHRILVAGMDAEGVPPDEIASRLGISVSRVDAILDRLDGVPHEDDEHRAPSVTPVRDARARDLHAPSEPIVVGSARRRAWNRGGWASGEEMSELGQMRREQSEVLLTSLPPQSAVGKPEGAVALLTLPIRAAALTAVADALELAYGPDLSLVSADGGMWVLGGPR